MGLIGVVFFVSHFLRYLGSGWVNIITCFSSFPIGILALNEALNYTRQMAAADKHSNKAKMACLLVSLVAAYVKKVAT